MSSVKIVRGPGADAPAPQNYADIKGQGKIPYAKIKQEATPNTAKGIMIKGKKRGMGEAERGGSYRSC